MKFSDRLSRLRKEKKLSRDELANKLGISYSAVSKYESGTREPDFKTLEGISRLFDVTTDYLLGRSEHPNLTEDMTLDEKVEELYDILKNMPEDKRKRMEEQILAYAKGLADANED